MPATPAAIPEGAGMRLSKAGLIVRTVEGLRQGLFPALAAMFGAGSTGFGWLIGIGVFVAILTLTGVVAYLGWTRFRYFVGAEDIRVESGILSREARSVPFERIQDVSIEEKLLPRLFGLAQVKFETGAGGKDEVALTYVSKEEGERLREVVRDRREHGASAAATERSASGVPVTKAPQPRGELLFAMPPERLFRFGLFEFSLIIFAVLAGAAQQLDFLVPWDPIEEEFRNQILGENRTFVDSLRSGAQWLGIVAGVAGIIGAGLLTGLARTFARDWDFRLERTPKGFRRRRGLFTRTDVVMPLHRVQAAIVNTGVIRRLFGWHSLKFVSLAQDAKSASHVVAPFAQMDEIWPIARVAGVEPPPADLEWVRPMWGRWFVGGLIATIPLIVGAAGAGVAVHWGLGAAILAVGLPLIWGSAVLSWRRHRHARGGKQLFVREGILSPELRIAQRLKLQSVEIAQGPLGRWLGYADVHFGLAGGKLAVQGVRLEDAVALRDAVMESIVEVDFSDLPR